MSGHTPGPWEIGDLYADDAGQPELAISAKVDGVDCYPAAVCLQFPNMEGMQMANARLIAAAPDLLDALRGMLFDGEGKRWPDSEMSDHEWDAQRERAQDLALTALATLGIP